MKTKVIKYDEYLTGIININNNDYKIPGTIVGEMVDVDISKDKKSCKLLKVLEQSSSRVKTICPVYSKCGGCALQHLNYNEQLKLKDQFVKDLYFNKYHKKFNFKPIIGAENPFNYRNKNHFVFQNLKGGKDHIACGFYQENTHSVIDFDHCFIHDEEANKIAAFIKEYMIKNHYQAYDEDHRHGLIRHVIIKKGFKTGEIMVIFVTATDVFPGSQNFSKELVKFNPHIKTIIQNINPRQTSVILGEKEKVIYGKGFIIDKLMNCTFKISSKSFYQINPVQCEKLYTAAITAAELSKNDVLFDAYCGVGTIGITASSHVKEVIGVELVKDAVRDAVENAKMSNVNNAKFYCDDATKFIKELAAKKAHIDVVIMDPPRKGSDKAFMNAVLQLSPKKIVYVSCDPRTQVNDVEYLLDKYQINSIQNVDMFPNTYHVETVICLSRK